MPTKYCQAGRVKRPLFEEIQHERWTQHVTFEQWLRSLMARERNYRNQVRVLHRELSRLRESSR